jgi:hypothetical protein
MFDRDMTLHRVLIRQEVEHKTVTEYEYQTVTKYEHQTVTTYEVLAAGAEEAEAVYESMLRTARALVSCEEEEENECSEFPPRSVVRAGLRRVGGDSSEPDDCAVIVLQRIYLDLGPLGLPDGERAPCRWGWNVVKTDNV